MDGKDDEKPLPSFRQGIAARGPMSAEDFIERRRQAREMQSPQSSGGRIPPTGNGGAAIAEDEPFADMFRALDKMNYLEIKKFLRALRQRYGVYH